jgi:predicted ArsR family transcriptional regulator
MASSDRSSKLGAFPETKLTSAQLRTLAHPLRSRLLQALRRRSPATATDLAQALGTNTGATSYHLRQLAEVGLIVEDDKRGPGRERWWRTAHKSHGWMESEVVDSADTQAAVDWILGHGLRTFVETAEACLAARKNWPQVWRDAMPSTEIEIELTPSEVAALNRELMDILHRYEQLPTDRESPDGEDRQTVWWFTHALPQLGTER